MRKIYALVLVALLVAGSSRAVHPRQGVTAVRTNYPVAHLPSTNFRGGGVICDTLQNFADTDTISLYLDPDGGYVSGQNSFGDIAMAEQYTGIGGGGSISTVIMLFGSAIATNATDTFTINIWDGTSGTPGNILASTNYTYQNAEADVTAQNFSIFNFSGPATLSGDFFAGMAIDYNFLGDTVALTTSQDLSVTPATAWSQFSDGSWLPFSDPNSWGLTVAHVVLPVVCGTSGVKNMDYDSKFAVYPTIASEKINVLIAPASETVSLKVTDLRGTVVISKTISTVSEHLQSVDVSELVGGTYFISMRAGSSISTRKFIVQR